MLQNSENARDFPLTEVKRARLVIPRLANEQISVRLPPMPILIIIEKTSQARDLRASS